MSISSRLILIACTLLLAACVREGNQDIKDWMREASKDLKGKVPPSLELKPFPPASYDASGIVDPFSASKLVPEQVARVDGIGPDLDRPKEPLESYPLESLQMTGAWLPSKGGSKASYALIKYAEGVGKVKVGNHLGQNFGVVIAITDNEVKIKETIKDPTGQTANWVDREQSLFLEGARK